MTFRRGQKVVCIRSTEPARLNEITPAVGTVYTVRNVRSFGARKYIRVHEIKNSPREYPDIGYAECWFTSEAFRPVVERETDISIFKRMLTPSTPKRARERADG